MKPAPPDPDHESDLLRRLRHGDAMALEIFTSAYLDRLYRFVFFRVGGDQQTAEDLTQESLVAAFGALERFDGRAEVFTWLCGIARHKVADHFRRLQRLGEIRSAFVAEPRDLIDPCDLVEREERRGLVLAALRALPPRYQQALTLKYLDRLSGRELAGQLQLSEDAAESLLARARHAFRRAYGDRGAINGEIGSHERI